MNPLNYPGIEKIFFDSENNVLVFFMIRKNIIEKDNTLLMKELGGLKA